MELETRPENCPTVYGPVQSRRHGLSLGVNLGLVESKICTWGCVYCQCGMGERREILPSERTLGSDEILKQVRDAIEKNPKIDSVTFAGNSEPTAHPDFKKIVIGILELRKNLKQKWIVNCLSNGSELHKPEVLEACQLLDEAWMKIDCALDQFFQRLSRPIARVGTVKEHVDRVVQLKPVFIQTLMWGCPTQPKLSNWTPENRAGLLEIYKRLRPKMIHLTTIARTPAVNQLEPIPESDLRGFAREIEALGLQVDVFK